MAVTVINLNDTISQWVTKSNTISTDLGDKATLTTAATNTVGAINELRTQLLKVDSADIISLIGIHAGVDSSLTIQLIRQQFNDTATIDFDSSAVELNLRDSCLTAKKFKTGSNIKFLNASGTTIAHMWSPDSPGA
jgi:hypothetical protein